MCGCQKHHDDAKPCTCICPEHGNFAAAYDLAMKRYDENQNLAARLAEVTAERDSLRGRLVELADVAEERGYDVQQQRERAEKAETENARLRDTLARVEALADDMKGEHGQSWNSISGQRILNALATEAGERDE